MNAEPDAAYHDVSPRDPPERPPPFSVPATASPAGKGRILVVDDDDSIRETLAELLELSGYCPLQAADAQEALEIRRQPAAVDVLLTDLSMRGADGIELIRLARAFREDLPAILLTGYADEVTTLAAGAGVNFHILRKPVSGARLLDQLERLAAKPLDA